MVLQGCGEILNFLAFTSPTDGTDDGRVGSSGRVAALDRPRGQYAHYQFDPLLLYRCSAAIRNVLCVTENQNRMADCFCLEALVFIAEKGSASKVKVDDDREAAIYLSKARENAATSLRAATYNPVLRDKLKNNGAIQIMLQDVKKGMFLAGQHFAYKQELLLDLEAESWVNGSRGTVKDGRAPRIEPPPLVLGLSCTGTVGVGVGVGDDSGAGTDSLNQGKGGKRVSVAAKITSKAVDNPSDSETALGITVPKPYWDFIDKEGKKMAETNLPEAPMSGGGGAYDDGEADDPALENSDDERTTVASGSGTIGSASGVSGMNAVDVGDSSKSRSSSGSSPSTGSSRVSAELEDPPTIITLYPKQSRAAKAIEIQSLLRYKVKTGDGTRSALNIESGVILDTLSKPLATMSVSVSVRSPVRSSVSTVTALASTPSSATFSQQSSPSLLSSSLKSPSALSPTLSRNANLSPNPHSSSYGSLSPSPHSKLHHVSFSTPIHSPTHTKHTKPLPSISSGKGVPADDVGTGMSVDMSMHVSVPSPSPSPSSLQKKSRKKKRLKLKAASASDKLQLNRYVKIVLVSSYVKIVLVSSLVKIVLVSSFVKIVLVSSSLIFTRIFTRN